MDQNCIICNEPAPDGSNLHKVGQLALNTLIQSSKKRKDFKFKTFSRFRSAFVHKSCCGMYNKERSIELAAAERSKKIIECKQIVKNAAKFDFTTNCFICGGYCDKKYHNISMVTKSDTRESIIEKLAEKNKTDPFNKNLSARLAITPDLVAVQARYHYNCLPKFYNNSKNNGVVGRPPSESTIDFIRHAVDFIEKNPDLSEYSLNEIKENFTGEVPRFSTIQSHLNTHYQNNQLEFIKIKKDRIITFPNKITKQMWTQWYLDNQQKDEGSKERIMEMAGKIVLEEISNLSFDKTNYTLPRFNETNVYDDLPDSLVQFLEVVIKNRNDGSKKREYERKKKIATISHSIISTSRPRSSIKTEFIPQSDLSSDDESQAGPSKMPKLC